MVLDAILAAEGNLDALLAQAAPRQTSDGLFVRRMPTAQDGETRATVTIRMLATNQDAIDTLVVKHGAESRSALCAAALRAYL